MAAQEIDKQMGALAQAKGGGDVYVFCYSMFSLRSWAIVSDTSNLWAGYILRKAKQKNGRVALHPTMVESVMVREQ